MTTITSSFGTFTEDQLKIFRNVIREMSDVYTMQDAQRDTLKEILEHGYSELGIPKAIIRKLARSYHKGNFDEVLTENSEFELFYEEVLNSKNP